MTAERLPEFQAGRVELPPGACATCGGEGQEQYLDETAPEGVAARDCPTCGGSGAAPKQ